MLYSCGTLKEGFSNNKKNTSDEFLVEKKSPLVMPPNYEELPLPSNEKFNKENQKNNIKSLISKEKDNEILENIQPDNNFEESILNKIKNN